MWPLTLSCPLYTQGANTNGSLPLWSRHYTIDVTVTNSAGLSTPATLIVPVTFNIRRSRRGLLEATTQALAGGEDATAAVAHEGEHHRQLHPGAASNGRRFKVRGGAVVGTSSAC